MAVIHDPNGQSAYVSHEGQLSTSARVSVDQHHANEVHGDAYIMDIDGITASGDGFCFLYIKNEDEHKSLIITSITLWTASDKDDANVVATLGETLTGVANETIVVPSNLNAGSGHTADGTFYVNDGGGDITTLTDGKIVGRWKPRKLVGKWLKESGWMLTKNQTFTLKCGKDNKFYGYVAFYYHEY